MTNIFPEFLLDLLFPKICRYCGDPFQKGLSNVLCRVCFERTQPYEDPVCDHCGVSLPVDGFEGAVRIRCRDCKEETYFLDRVRAFGVYEGPLRIAHRAFKFEGMDRLRVDVAEQLLRSIPASFWEGVEVLVPVPLSPERERERGYNPAVLLAQELSNKTKIPIDLFLRKIRSTVPQMSLSREKRIHNPKGAYKSVSTRPFSKVVLVDDVFTTGATLEECARAIKQTGVSWVGAVVFGRTPRYGSARN
jgi:ComF family protein